MMLGCNETITLYSKRRDSATKTDRWPKTVISGVSWAGEQRVTVGNGLTSDDGYSIRIPKSSLPDGFLRRDEYNALQDPSGHWTVQNGDVVVLGIGPDATGGITEITKQFTDCFTVTAVHTDNLRRPLPHLRLEGE